MSTQDVQFSNFISFLSSMPYIVYLDFMPSGEMRTKMAIIVRDVLRENPARTIVPDLSSDDPAMSPLLMDECNKIIAMGRQMVLIW